MTDTSQLQEMLEKVSAKAHRAEQAVIDLTRKLEALSERVKALGGAEPEARPLTVDDEARPLRPLTVDDMEPGDHVIISGHEHVVVMADGDRAAVPIGEGCLVWLDARIDAVLYRRSEMGQ